MDISNLKRDTASIEAGQWVDDIPGMGDLRLKVRGMGSKLFQTTFARLARGVPKSDRQRDGSLTLEASMKVMGEALHETVLLDWEGLESDGKALAYDKDTAKALLTDQEYRPFIDAVTWCAGVVDNGRAAAVEDLVKNSAPSSAGK